MRSYCVSMEETRWGAISTAIILLLLAINSVATPLDKRSLQLIGELNGEGPYIGVVTVYPPEEKAFFDSNALKPHPKYPFLDLSGRRFRVGKIHGKKVIYVRCGVGMVNAAAASQQLFDLFDVTGIVHFGIAGNVNSSFSIGDVTIPKYVAHTGIWEWLNIHGEMDKKDFGMLVIGRYNKPRAKGKNALGRIGYQPEEFYSHNGKPNVPEDLIWAQTTSQWQDLAKSLEGMKLDSCLNSSLCVANERKLVVGLRAATANIFVDNAAYRRFLFHNFHVSSVDEESASIVMTSLSNGFPVIVIRGLSDLAGGQKGQNAISTFGPLAARNAVKATLGFIDMLP
ncbi:bark storage protein A [Amborella trichopoda]|nr:bark storage protein A [Amborella trichopoda]|eukprot:XP_006846768.2 bark storage protein A [Amborella trichopoda]